MKLTLVVQRYGEEVVGGAERLARGVAEGLAPRHDVEVVTTCALSYRTWANHYPEGATTLNGVRLRRFRTDQERNIDAFNTLSESLFGGARTPEDELAWIDAQDLHRLVDHLHAVAPDRDLLLFFTYLYHPTVHGIHARPEASVLVPTAHDEGPLYLEAYRSVFTLPCGLIFNTVAEQELVRRRFPEVSAPSVVVGAGIEGLEELEQAAQTAAVADPPVLLYAGRIDAGKGVGELVRYLERFREDTGTDLRLWLIGELAMALPAHDWIEPLGYVDEEEKRRRMAAATVLAAPSALESFGIVMLEALAAGTPALVNGASRAYVEHCTDGRAGLWYTCYGEFREALTLLLQNTRLRETMAANGASYVRNRYSWGAVVERYEEFLAARLT